MTIAVETIPAPPRQSLPRAKAGGEGIKKSRFVLTGRARGLKAHGSARIAVLPAANAAQLGGFVRSNAKPGARIITDGLKSYEGLADSFRHDPIIQDGGKTPMPCCPSSMSCSAT